MNVTRTTNPNGTYRYVIDGEVHYKASKVRYDRVSTYTNGAVLFHKTPAAAGRATGYKGWTKAAIVAIVDGDVPAPAAEPTPAPAPATKPAVRILLTEQVRTGHVLVTRDGARMEVLQYATTCDWRTGKLDPTSRTFHVKDEAGVTQVYKAKFGRRLRVAA